MVTTITNRESVPVTIGTLTLWCEDFKAAAVRSFTEESLVSGGAVVTNTCPKSMKLTFSGRICSGDAPLDFVKTASDMLRSGESYTVTYRGFAFGNCRVQSFSAEDKGEDFAGVSVVLVTGDSVSEVESV